MKFLYPIKKLNIKPWIKYWLLKKGLNPIVLSDLIEGTSPITIENVYEGTTLQELAFKGQTIQDRIVKGDNYININNNSYRIDLGGKNLLANNITSQTISGVTITKNDDGSLLLNGTTTDVVRLNLMENYIIKTGNYIFSINKEGTLNNSAYISLLKTGTTTELSGAGINLYSQDTKSFSIRENTDVYARLYIGSGRTFTNFKIYPMLEQGSQATTYSPYTASPIELTENDKIWNNNGTWQLNDTVITDTYLVNQLNAIIEDKLISGTNKITQNPSDLPFILNFKYYMKG